MRIKKPNLFIISGLPGSGKTTLAKQMSKKYKAIRLCPDEWMEDFGISLWDEHFRASLEKRLWGFGKEALSLGNNVVVEFGSWTKEERMLLLEEGKKVPAKVTLYFINPEFEEIKRRLSKRDNLEDKIIEEKLVEYASLFQNPDIDETTKYDKFIEIK